MYILIRTNSPYTINDFLLGIFDSEILAEKYRKIYISERSKYDLFDDQAYHTVNLEVDVYIHYLDGLNVEDGCVKVWLSYSNGMGQSTIDIHTSEPDLTDRAFATHKEEVIFKLNKLYDELGIFSDELPDKITSYDIDAFRESCSFDTDQCSDD